MARDTILGGSRGWDRLEYISYLVGGLVGIVRNDMERVVKCPKCGRTDWCEYNQVMHCVCDENGLDPDAERTEMVPKAPRGSIE